MAEMKEPVVLVDKDDNELGVQERDQAEQQQSNVIRMVYLLFYDKNGRVLLQRRRPDLARYPNYWTVSATGAVRHGEGYVQAGLRKAKDELGVEPELSLARKTIMPIPGRASLMVALFTAPIEDAASIDPDSSRVQEVRWLTLEEARQGYLLTPTAEQVLAWIAKTWQK